MRMIKMGSEAQRNSYFLHRNHLYWFLVLSLQSTGKRLIMETWFQKMHKITLSFSQKLHRVSNSLGLCCVQTRFNCSVELKPEELLTNYKAIEYSKQKIFLPISEGKVHLIRKYLLVHGIPTQFWFAIQGFHRCRPWFGCCKQKDACQDSLLSITLSHFYYTLNRYHPLLKLYLSCPFVFKNPASDFKTSFYH